MRATQNSTTTPRDWYANEIWGRRIHDDETLFEVMSLQVFQAGLGWRMILDKRDAFRRAFRNWDVSLVANLGSGEIEELRGDVGIIRNRQKINAVIFNAQKVMELQRAHGSFIHWFYEVLEGVTYPVLQALITPRFKFMGPELCRMWLMATGRITMAEGDLYRPSETPRYATGVGPITARDASA